MVEEDTVNMKDLQNMPWEGGTVHQSMVATWAANMKGVQIRPEIEQDDIAL